MDTLSFSHTHSKPNRKDEKVVNPDGHEYCEVRTCKNRHDVKDNDRSKTTRVHSSKLTIPHHLSTSDWFRPLPKSNFISYISLVLPGLLFITASANAVHGAVCATHRPSMIKGTMLWGSLSSLGITPSLFSHPECVQWSRMLLNHRTDNPYTTPAHLLCFLACYMLKN